MIDRAKLIQKVQILREKRIREARKSFYAYCQSINPKFYKPNRLYLKRICDNMQGVYEGTIINPNTGKPYKKMTLSVPPGHGKSYTASLFSNWLYGQDSKNQIITVSYNETLSGRFGRTVRDGIDTMGGDPKEITFADVFPDVKVQYGDASYKLWSLEGSYMSYLATSFKASITGMRGNIGIIDDPVKNAQDAFNERVLQEQWEWYTDTFLSRMLEGGIQIIIGTRWATKDLIGRVIEAEPGLWLEMKLPACEKETKEMLCEDILSYDTYQARKKLTSVAIFNANYDQEPMDLKGRLYTAFKTYEHIPKDAEGNPLFEQIVSYTDTADLGSDYLVSIVAGIYDGYAYVLDVLYTQDAMEVTEPATAKMFVEEDVSLARIESNNGGRGFARNVESIILRQYKTRKVKVNWFHQSKNKRARILTNATRVMNNVLFPVNWADRWNDYYVAMNTYKAEGGNEHDDAPDATTGLVEMMDKQNRRKAKAVQSI